MLFSSCSLQGPWDYKAEKQDIYRGLFVSAHLVADRSLDKICIEPIYDLKEARADNFSFYDSIEIDIYGDFSNGDTSANLVALKDYPNCFRGDTNSLVLRDTRYRLAATVWWDSVGTKTKTEIKSETKVPTSFETINGNANAASASGANADAVLFQLLLDKYGDEVSGILNDSLALAAFLFSKKDELPELLKNSPKAEFNSGDTLIYLDNPLSGEGVVFYNEYSDDVKGIYMTIYNDSSGGLGERPWQNIGGIIEIDTINSAPDYFSSAVTYMSRFPLADGSDLLDSIMTFNFYFTKGKNRFFFYGVDTTFNNYYTTLIDGNSRTKKVFNIDGAIGFFSGMIVDSLEVEIVIPKGDLFFPFMEARSQRCSGALTSKDASGTYDDSSKESAWRINWYKIAYCEEMYDIWCDTTAYDGVDCIGAGVKKSLNENKAWNSVLDSLDLKFEKEDLDIQKEFGEVIYCLDNNFSDATICQSYKEECFESSEKTDCMEYLWRYCINRKWDIDQYPQCGSAMVSYNLENDLNSLIWDREVEKFCLANPQVEQCKR